MAMPFNLQQGLCHTQVYCTQSPWSCNSPLLTHTSTGDTQTQFLLSLCGVSGSGCTQGLFESSEHLWWAQGFLLALDVATLRVGLPEKSSKNWKKKTRDTRAKGFRAPSGSSDATSGVHPILYSECQQLQLRSTFPESSEDNHFFTFKLLKEQRCFKKIMCSNPPHKHQPAKLC